MMYIYAAEGGRIDVIHAPHLAGKTAETADLTLQRQGNLTIGSFLSDGHQFVVVSNLSVAQLKPYIP